MAEKYENLNDGLLLNLFGGSNGADKNSKIEGGGGGGEVDPGDWEG